MNKRKLYTPADIILIAVLLIISGSLIVISKNNANVEKVQIFRHNVLVGEYSMQEDQIIKIDDNIVIEIRNGKIRMKESDCKNKYCVKQGWSNHFPIVCVPNEISIVFNKKDEMLITR